MNSTNKYILEYAKDFAFDHSGRISVGVFDVEIYVDVFEHHSKLNYRETAHVVFKKGDLIYECNFCDRHHYQSDFYPITLNGQRFICFRKTLYGFTLINADTLSTEYEYFPESVIHGEESFIIMDAKTLDDFLIFEGCYWACPDECFAFNYKTKQFLNVSKMCDVFSLDRILLQDNNLILYGTDENDIEKQVTVSKQDIALGMSQNGQEDF